MIQGAVYRLHRPARASRAHLYLMAQGGSRSLHRGTRTGYSFSSGSDGNTHVQHGQPGSSQERKCAAAIPDAAHLKLVLLRIPLPWVHYNLES